MTDILDDLAQYERRQNISMDIDPVGPGLLLDLGGRLHLGDQVLPWAPASSIVGGTVPVQVYMPGLHLAALLPADGPGATVTWRETTMEAHERQAGVR